MNSNLKNRWSIEGGYREVLTISFPLIVSTASLTLQHLVDRMFLAWYSTEAIAAVMPAGLLSFTILSLFIGTASYVSTFVSQHIGSGQDKAVGPYLFQGIWFSALAGLAVLPLIPMSETIFRWIGHIQEIRNLEQIYFQVLIFSGFPATAAAAFDGLFAGCGRTKTIMYITLASTIVNVCLDYILIFGHLGFPRMGMYGAALATVISQWIRLTIQCILAARPELNHRYAIFTSWRFDSRRFRRLMSFGIPSGMHYLLETSGYTMIVLLIGTLGAIPLAATNITFSINNLSFMPLMGLGMGVSVLIGKRLGENSTGIAVRTAWSAFHLAAGFILLIAAAYVLIPGVLLWPYVRDNVSFLEISKLARTLLIFVAFYSFFDAMGIVFASVVKGAGDTRFVMKTTVLLSWTIMVIPSYLALKVFSHGLYTVWCFAALYIVLLGIVFALRFQKGKWKEMRVIESPPPIPGDEAVEPLSHVG